MNAQLPLTIPFNRPSIAGKEITYIENAVKSGHTAGDGPYSKLCHQFLESELGCAKALLTTSCTHALEMAAILLGLKEGDEVLFPSYTFVSTVNAFVLRGVKPIFVDIRSDTLNIDERFLADMVTPRTRAIVPVHYAGVACEMEHIMKLSIQRELQIVEDNAHGLFGRYKGQQLGTFGCLATQSFHETKNFSCGEGGALIINDPNLIERAEIIREKGTNRSRFYRGAVDKYTWVDIGSSYLPSDILAAYLWAQMECKDVIQHTRQSIWTRYANELHTWSRTHGVQLPTVPSDCEQAYHMFYMIMPTLEARQGLIAHLRKQGILAVFHYVPLHLSEMGQAFGGRQGMCPVAETVSDRLIRLPFFNNLQPAEQERIIEAVISFHP